MPFFMQWDHPEQYPGAMLANHQNGARGVSSLSLTPRDGVRFLTWTSGADVPIDVVHDREPGLWSFGIHTDDGELVVNG